MPRGTVAPDLSALPVETGGKPPTRPGEYRKLPTAECRTLAIENAPFAKDLDEHSENQAPNHPLFHPLKPKPKEAELGRRARGYLADDFRNKAAGDALDDFYQLAQSEGQFDLLAKSLGELRARLADAEEALKRGLADRSNVDALRVQVLDMEAKIAQLEAGIGALNASVRARLNLQANDPMPLWPDDPLRVRPEDVDVDQAVKTGLYYRPDLNLLRTLLSDNGRAADDLTSSLLKQVSPLLAHLRSNPIIGVLLPRSRSEERESTRRQMESMLRDRERQAEAEIRAESLTLRGDRLACEAKAAEVRRQQTTLQDVEKRAAAGQPVTAELTKAKLDLWKAKGELLKAAIDWHRADVKLRKAMGLLVRE
ncbi:MAG TPA: TolC family protein [Gemmataceae bacterium]|jgi:outer membrane protein TolC